MLEPEDRSPFPRRDTRQVQEELTGLLLEAKRVYRRRQVRQAAQLLCQAQSLANQHSLYSEAARVQQALGILSSGGKPRLLSRGPVIEEH